MEEKSLSDNDEFNAEDNLEDSNNQETTFSMETIIRDTIQDSLNAWFDKNLKPIVEESVRQEVSKLFKKRN